ncbi:hypothetical protein HX857_09635 [Pseudomonas gingeri]|uniref:hypothetical protein n=1 Tax=Pseudomonas gingeri TaxID=117681 RepID=UPI0015BA4544|nr:hypothetical protein [Pseudomonas gingeri]NWE68967.1 hypothetical protein [Pseudomonas gingeri]
MTDYTDLQKAAEYAAQDTIKFADEAEEMRALQHFHEEVDPERVLALIAENQQLSHVSGCHLLRAQTLEVERDQLKAENEALRKLMGDFPGFSTGSRDYEREWLEAWRVAMSKGEQP